jgi:magnesium transporter
MASERPILPQQAADQATERVPVAAPRDRVGDVCASLRGAELDSASAVAVLDGDRLVGIVPIERLLSGDPAATLATVMDPDPPSVPPGAAREVAAWRVVERGGSSAAVVGEDGRFHGLIPPDRMLAVLLAEHDEDLARLGGYIASTKRARQAAEEPVGRRLLHRLPWLLVGLGGAMASAVLVGAFEQELREKVLLAFFVPRGRLHGGRRGHPDGDGADPRHVGGRPAPPGGPPRAADGSGDRSARRRRLPPTGADRVGRPA